MGFTPLLVRTAGPGGALIRLGQLRLGAYLDLVSEGARQHRRVPTGDNELPGEV